MNTITRRSFLRKLFTGMSLTVLGSPKRGAWPVSRSKRGSVRLVFYTDVHARTEWNTPLAIARAADAINARGPDLVIAGGDLITEGFESSPARVAPRWDVYMKMHRAVKGDVYPVIGNHDLVAALPRDGTPRAEDPRSIYRDLMGLERTYYSFDAVGYHFVMLDSIQITGDELAYQGLIWPEELEWLRQNLSRVPHGTPIVVATHMPLLSVFHAAIRGLTLGAERNRVVVNNLDVLRVLEDHNVVLVLQGHLHAKELVMWRETTFIVGGAICGKWWRGPWYGTKEGFNVITLTGNRVGWEYVDYGWEARRPEEGSQRL